MLSPDLTSPVTSHSSFLLLWIWSPPFPFSSTGSDLGRTPPMLPAFLLLLLAVALPGGQLGCSIQPFLGKNLEEVSAQSISHQVKRVPLGGTFQRPRYLKLGSTGWLVKDVGHSDSSSFQNKISKVLRILRQGATVRGRKPLERIVREILKNENT